MAEGKACQVDSDCAAGLVCGLDGACTTFGKIEAAFNARPDVDIIVPDAPSDAPSDGPVDTPSECIDPTGSFSCDGPDLAKVVTLYEIPPEGHGAAGMSGVSATILQQGFEQGVLYTEVWVDGTFVDGCNPRLGWVRDSEDVGADCQPLFIDRIAVEIPGIVELYVYDYSVTIESPARAVVNGLLNKQEILAALDPSFRNAFDGLVVEDVDLDGDGTPDRASIILIVTFQ